MLQRWRSRIQYVRKNVGWLASMIWLTCAPASASPSVTSGSSSICFDRREVLVEERHAADHVAIGLERQLDERGRRADPARDGDRRQRIRRIAVVAGVPPGGRMNSCSRSIVVPWTSASLISVWRNAASRNICILRPLTAARSSFHDGAPSNGVRVSRPNSTPTPRAVVCGRTVGARRVLVLGEADDGLEQPGAPVRTA